MGLFQLKHPVLSIALQEISGLCAAGWIDGKGGLYNV